MTKFIKNENRLNYSDRKKIKINKYHQLINPDISLFVFQFNERTYINS